MVRKSILSKKCQIFVVFESTIVNRKWKYLLITFTLKTGSYCIYLQSLYKKKFKYHSEKVKFSINFNEVIKVLISLTLKVISPQKKKQVRLQMKRRPIQMAQFAQKKCKDYSSCL